MMELANKLRQWREQKRWSQLEIALMIGVSQSTYGTWEYNVIPKAKYYPKLAEIFDVDIYEFFPEVKKKEVIIQNIEKEAFTDKLILTLEETIKTKDELIFQLKTQLSFNSLADNSFTN